MRRDAVESLAERRRFNRTVGEIARPALLSLSWTAADAAGRRRVAGVVFRRRPRGGAVQVCERVGVRCADPRRLTIQNLKREEH